MAIVCVKIGENEQSTYTKFGRLSKHLDIIEVLPRKRDAQGNLLERTAGVSADKEYLNINVNMDSLTDEEFELVRALLKERYEEDTGTVDDSGRPIFNLISKRKRYLDIPNFGDLIGFDSTRRTALEALAERRRNRLAYDAREHHISIAIPFLLFSRVVKNKVTGQSLKDELGLTIVKTIKDKIAKVRELLGMS